MLLTVGQQQIALNKNVSSWKPIVDYCNNHKGNFTFEESIQLGSYAADAETYFESVEKITLATLIKKDPIEYKWPVTAILLNMNYSTNSSFNRELAITEFSTKLGIVTIPTLLLYGKYDFICPGGLEDDVYKRINTTDKKLAISPISGHDIMLQDESFFCNEVNAFIEKHK